MSMTPTERALLMAMARWAAASGDKSVRQALAAVEQDERCPHDGNRRPCPHHEFTEATHDYLNRALGMRGGHK